MPKSSKNIHTQYMKRSQLKRKTLGMIKCNGRLVKANK